MGKDVWDKAEILGKAVGAIFIPLAIGIATISLNSQNSKRSTAAQMATIAVGILSEKPENDAAGTDALREWALSVLENPGEVVPLSSAAADDLRSRRLSLSLEEGIEDIVSQLSGLKVPPELLNRSPIIQEPFVPSDDGETMLQEPYRPEPNQFIAPENPLNPNSSEDSFRSE